jgi:hypothetical protein
MVPYHGQVNWQRGMWYDPCGLGQVLSVQWQWFALAAAVGTSSVPMAAACISNGLLGIWDVGMLPPGSWCA